ncbi:phosphoglycerate dehydrogenase [Methanosphaera sp. WGK6]|uniref:phosphoglycerate dehydrogenase n=1 Tax=Methanosphaera sp. WGK6 TaxID=1561964 RepID=UPI00084BDE93|nr:phosphoglycerate dehydrogenase [Methanosphaera sp. WGK6]OED30461.1 D-3-phosphoglycerate dehydrogenase [Methanosphaera sp. WGK6]
MSKVLVADKINEKGVEVLEGSAEIVNNPTITPEELLETIDQYEGIIVRSRTKVTKEVIENAKNLKIIARAGVGVDNIDVQAATDNGILVVNAPQSTSITVAEHAMGLMLSLSRKIAIADASVKSGKWEKSKFMGMELKNKILGVIGMGRIGSEVVKRAKAFEMDVVVYDPYISDEVAKNLGVEIVEFEKLIEVSDVMTIHVPLTPETKGLISKDQLYKMKDHAIILNCARGGIINEDDLYEVLKERPELKAGLDVYENEPLKESPLQTLDNVVLTPHIAASTKEAQRDAAIIVAKQVKEVINGETPSNVLNMPIVDSETFQKLKPYFKLTEKLGQILVQTTTANISELNIVYSGEISGRAKEPLTRELLKEFLNPILTEPVNSVNAKSVAKQRGVKVTEGETEDSGKYDATIKISVKYDDKEMTIEGTVENNELKIISIDDYDINLTFEGLMGIVKYTDLPGTIGKIGNVLGDYKINIAEMKVGRKSEGGEAVMVIKVDQEITEEVVSKLEETEYIDFVKSVKL